MSSVCSVIVTDPLLLALVEELQPDPGGFALFLDMHFCHSVLVKIAVSVSLVFNDQLNVPELALVFS